LTVRVIITDSSDCIVREWKYGQGVTFPPEDLRRDRVTDRGAHRTGSSSKTRRRPLCGVKR
jgi:hypothetical protein